MRRFWLIPALILVIAAYAAVDDDSGLRSLLSLREVLLDEEAKVAALRAEIEDLSQEVGALEREPFAVERAIREDLEYARPGEIIVRLPRSTGR